MDEVFSFFTGEIQSLVEWALQADPLYVLHCSHSV